MLEVKPFISAYDDYEKLIATIPADAFILEVGVGAFPSVTNNKNYYCLDPDGSELSKLKHCNKVNCTLEEYSTSLRFDFIVSQMVLEHVENPFDFHRKALSLLKPNGKVIHFFACGKSIPSIINSLIPENWSDFILRKINSRDVDNEPKYIGHYLWTDIFNEKIINNYVDLGYSIFQQSVYIGHNYLHSVPFLRILENVFSMISYKLKWKHSASVALLVLGNNINNTD